MDSTVAGKRLATGAIANWCAFAANLLVAFFLAPFLIHKLGDAQYGLWIFIESLLAYLTLFDLGLAASLVRFLARYEAQGEITLRNRLVNTALAFYAGLGGGAFLIGALAIPWFTLRVTHQEPLPQNEMIFFGILMACNLGLTLPLSVFPSILDGLGRFGLKSIVRIVVLTLKTLAILICMETQPSLLGLGIILFCANLLEHAIIAGVCSVLLRDLKFSRALIHRETFQQIKGYSLNAFVLMLAGRASVQTGPILVGLFLSAPEVTFFGIAWRLSEFAKALPRSATNTLTTAFSRFDAQRNLAESQRLFLNASRLALWVILPIQLGLFFQGPSFLETWLGSPTHAQQVYPSLVILSSVLTLLIAQSVAARVLYGAGQLRWFARWACVEAIINLTLGIVLAPRYGIKGVAWGMIIPNLFMNVWVIREAIRLLGIPLQKYLLSTLMPVLCGASLLCGAWLLLGAPSVGWQNLILNGVQALLPYVLFVFIWERWLQPIRQRIAETKIPSPEWVSLR
jgi:O-antigen/teichoic acid export membrane protein